jgi:hypothetical protein
MANRNKFEEMLERLVNEDREGAEELFHEIVVEKSRDIYEGLLESDLEVDESDDEETTEASDEEVDESEDDLEESTDEEVDESDDEVEEASDEEVEEDFDLDEFEVEADPMDMMGGDAADDMMGAMEPGDDEEMGDEGEGDMEDRVEDLEDALDELKAEFEKMMSDDEGGDDDEEDMDMDMDDEGDEAEEESFEFEATDEEVDEASDEEVEEAEEEAEESVKSEAEQMREYVEKVSAKMGDNGANAKSVVAGPNNMGGTSANIAKGGEADSKGAAGGLANPATKEDDAGNINVPGGKASKSMKSQPGHGAEKKGKPETADNKKSPVGK